MSSTNRLLMLAALVIAANATAQTTQPYTLDEAAELAGKIARAEQLAKLREAQKRAEGTADAGSGSATPMLRAAATASASQTTNILFLAEYGMGRNLYGDFEINGVPVTLSLQQKNSHEGWTLENLTPDTAYLVLHDKKGKVIERRKVVLSAKMMPTQAPAQTSGAASGTTVPNLRPAQ